MQEKKMADLEKSHLEISRMFEQYKIETNEALGTGRGTLKRQLMGSIEVQIHSLTDKFMTQADEHNSKIIKFDLR